MSKVIVNADTSALRVQFKATLGSSERTDGSQGLLGIKAEPNQNGKRTDGIDRIVLAGDG
jgi:hypothetical protein